MSIQLRFALLLSLFFGGMVLTLLLLRRMEHAEAGALVRTDRDTRAQLLEHWVDAASRALPQFASDLAQSEDLANLLAHAELEASRAKFAASLHASGVASLWLLRDDGQPIFSVSAAGVTAPSATPLSPADFTALVSQTPHPRFFAEQDGTLLEICIRRLQPLATAAQRPWLMLAKRWDDAHLRSLAALTEGNASLVARHAVGRAPASDRHVQITRPLADWQGRTLRVLRVDYEIPALESAVQSTARQSNVFIVFALLLTTAFGLALYRWVLRPLRQIEHSLASRDAALVTGLSKQPNELGRVAELVATSFDQQAALEREVAERRRTQVSLERSEASLRENLEERARLGRDLHDGVIQSLYAAGMGLAGVRMQLRPEQTEAATRLEQTRAALNETIHDVRNFIIGLEPEALRLQTFSQAVAGLLEVMRGMRAFQSSVEIDESLARRLTLAQRVHALQIAREAVSNALRHGQASHIQVALRQRGEFAEFEVIDNGRGFDASATSQGKGLANFADRARELGGELLVDSRPGEGVRVKLAFSLLIL